MPSLSFPPTTLINNAPVWRSATAAEEEEEDEEAVVVSGARAKFWLILSANLHNTRTPEPTPRKNLNEEYT